ncbi:hypothetical protein Unana1_03271 [Umbelopsis nana]
MSYMTRDELNKYLKNLPSSPTGPTAPKTPLTTPKETPVSTYGTDRKPTANGLRGPRPPNISSPRSYSPKSTASPTIEDVKADLTYPFERKLNISDPSPDVAKSAQDLKTAVGMTTGRSQPPPPVKAKPASLSRNTSSDAFESSLARGKPLPPSTQPKISTQPAIANPPMSSNFDVTSPASPSPSANEKVSVPNPLYASIRCGGCQKAISGVVINAMSKRWHANCFKCKQCGENLEHMAFFEKDGFPYCGLDYHEQFSLRCDYCNTPIEEASGIDSMEWGMKAFINKSINALGKHYHEGHFFCRECGNPFDEGGFMVHDGHPYCEKDYLRKFGQKCMGCGEYMSGEFLNALGGDWHKDCFVCTECKEPFESETFYVRNNKPYCQRHYKTPVGGGVKSTSVCAGCGDYIEGRAATALNQKWHPHHFQCVSCKKELSASVPGQFMPHRNQFAAEA